MSKPSLRQKLREWFIRYIPAEIFGTCAAFAGAYITHQLTGSLLAAAMAGSITETIGFYSYFIVHDGQACYNKYRDVPLARRLRLTVTETTRDLLLEFGVAELADSLLIRPFCMYMGPQLLHNFSVGLLAGKLSADLVFYVFAAAGYELKKYLRVMRTRKIVEKTEA